MNSTNVNYVINRLKDSLEYGYFIEDYLDSTDTIETVIDDITNDSIDIQYPKLLQFVQDHSEYMDEVVKNGIYDLNPRTYDFFGHIEAAQWSYINNELYSSIYDIVLLAAYVHCQDIGKENLTEDENDQLINIVKGIDITEDSFADECESIDEIFTE